MGQCYQLKGERTRKFCANLKPALQKLLEQRFSELDGAGPSKAPKKAPGVLPALRGSKSPQKSRPSAAGQSRDSSRNSSSAGSVMSLTKHMEFPGSRVPTRESELKPKPALVMPSDAVAISSDPFAPAPMEDPNFIPSPTTEGGLLGDNADDDAFMRELEAL